MIIRSVTCPRGHDLANRFSYRRLSNGVRWCLACAAIKYPRSRRATRRLTRAAQDRKNSRQDRRYRAHAQAIAVAASIRATTPDRSTA